MRQVPIIRLCVWLLVGASLAAIFALRSRDDGSERGTGALYHGQTPEKLLAAAAVRDGKVRNVYMRWRMTCERGREPYTSTIRFGEQFGDEFHYDGRSFGFSGQADQSARAGYTVRYSVEIGGTLSGDERRVQGHGRTAETWLRNQTITDVCHSKDVSWTAHRGAVVNP